MGLKHYRYVFLTVQEARSLRVAAESGRARFWVPDFSRYPHGVARARNLSGVSFVRALMPFMKVPSS